jgi:adenylosuccinate synthase
VAARFAAQLNGCTAMAILKLDPLDIFPVLRVCTGYEVDGKVITHMPTTRALSRARPIVEELPGWETPITKARTFADLPSAAQNYVLRLEELIGVPVRYVGVGASREALIIRD